MKQSQQDKILAMHEDGFTPREMLNELEKDNSMATSSSVYATLSKFRLKPNQRRCPTCGNHLTLENP